MVEKGLTESEGQNGMVGSRGSSVKGILFFLFALAVCFGYFYFFTDILRPKEETPGQPDVFTSEVKKPLPERLVQSSATSGEEAVSPSPVASSLHVPPTSGDVATDSKVSPGDVPPGHNIVLANKAPVKQKTVSAKPVLDSADRRKSSADLKHSETKTSHSLPKAKTGASRVSKVNGETKKVFTGQKPEAVKIAKIPSKIIAPKNQEISKQLGTKKVGERFTLVVGNYVLKSSMRFDKVKLEKSGLQTSVLPGKMRNEPMNRLLVAEVASYPAAQEELAKVKKASKDAFFLRENNKYAIYAGSYFAHDRAIQEQERLRKQGFAPILKVSPAPVPTYTLAAGSYPTRDAALKGAERLRKLGFKPYPVKIEK